MIVNNDLWKTKINLYCVQHRQCTYNMTLRWVREALLTWKSNNYIFMCVRERLRACARARWRVHVRVVLFIQHETHMRHIVTSFVARFSPPYFPTLFHKWHDFWEKAIEHTIHWWGQRNMYSMEQRHSWEANRSSVRKYVFHGAETFVRS
jgi:hypothetical protein